MGKVERAHHLANLPVMGAAYRPLPILLLLKATQLKVFCANGL